MKKNEFNVGEKRGEEGIQNPENKMSMNQVLKQPGSSFPCKKPCPDPKGTDSSVIPSPEEKTCSGEV